MKKIITCLFIFSFVSSLSAQGYFWGIEKGEPRDSITGVKIKSVNKCWDSYCTKTKYNKEGKLQSQVTLQKGTNGDTTFVSKDSITRDTNGELIKWEYYVNGKINECHEYFFNTNNKLIKEIYTYRDKSETSTYVYNDKGQLTENNISEPLSSYRIIKYTYSYDANGKISEEKSYMEGYEGEYSFTKYTYNSENQLTEEENNGHNRIIYGYTSSEYYYEPYTYVHKYEYDKTGRMLKDSYSKTVTDKNEIPSGPDVETYEYTESAEGSTMLKTNTLGKEKYMYDTAGMLIKVEHYNFNDKTPSRTEAYTYEFF
jgi:hypothetical protein